MRKPPSNKSLPFKNHIRFGRKLLKTTVERSEAMSRVRRSGTEPEQVVRGVLSALRVRFTSKNSDLPGSPDFANRTRRIVVFVHGCFWHRHDGCKRASTPKRNRGFWLEKFDDNVKRDRRVARLLRKNGFTVVTVWECRTKTPAETATRLRRLLSNRRARSATQ